MTDEEQGTLRHVAWKDVFPWLMIARSFRLAIGVRALVAAAVAITLTVVGWWCFGRVFAPDEAVALAPYKDHCPWTPVTKVVPDAPGAGLPGVGPAPGRTEFDVQFGRAPTRPDTGGEMAGGPWAKAWTDLSRPFVAAFGPAVSFGQLVYLLFCGLWALAVWAFFGAVITRPAAVRLACDERVSLGASIQHARSKWGSYFAAPLFPLVGVFLAVLPVFAMGLLLKFGFGTLIAGIFWFLALLAGLMMAVLLLGLVFGWPLMWATISAEGTDAFDALSRSYAYVFQRPLHYLFYVLVATVIGGLGWLVVSNFAAGVIYLTYWAAGWGLGDNAADLVAKDAAGAVSSAGLTLVRFWVDCVKLLAVGYLFAYFWTASTAIYLLLRRDVDATETDEVFLEEEEEQQPGYGLPPLKTDSAGAPVAEDQPPQTPPENQE